MKFQYESLSKIFKQRQLTYSELEAKHTSLAKALAEIPDSHIRNLVEAKYEANVKSLSVAVGAAKVEGEDKERERLEIELRKHQLLAEQYKRESEAKEAEIEELQDKLNASGSQVIP